MSVTRHCTDQLGHHSPHEWSATFINEHDLPEVNYFWCPGVKPSPSLQARLDRVAELQRELDDATDNLRAVSYGHRRTYDEAIEGKDL
jgi:hypothetical protein